MDSAKASNLHWPHGCRTILTFSWMSQWQAYPPPLRSVPPLNSSHQQGKAVQDQHTLAHSQGCHLSQDQGRPLAPLGQASPQGLGLPLLGHPLGPLLLGTLLLHPLSWRPHPCLVNGQGRSLSIQEEACFSQMALRNDIASQDVCVI